MTGTRQGILAAGLGKNHCVLFIFFCFFPFILCYRGLTAAKNWFQEHVPDTQKDEKNGGAKT
jgi:hypothetical protein